MNLRDTQMIVRVPFLRKRQLKKAAADFDTSMTDLVNRILWRGLDQMEERKQKKERKMKYS